MTKLWLVALHEYRRNVFKKSFILALLSVPWMIGLNVGVGLFMESRDKDYSPVGYVDHAGVFVDPIPAPVDGPGKAVAFVPFQTEDDARAALESRDIQAYYVVAADYYESKNVGLFYLKQPGRNATREFYDFLQINLLEDRPPEIAHRAARISENVIVRSLDGRRQIPSGGPTFRIIMPILIGLAFVVLLAMNSGYLMQAVVDEKENRTMEVLVTSASPVQLIGGKVLGIVGVSLTQLVTWAAIGVLGIIVARNSGIAWFQDLDMDWGTVLATVAVAVPSYVLACALMTAIGATVTSAQEGQSVAAVFFLLYGGPLFIAWPMLQSPQAAAWVLLSLFPIAALPTIILRNIFAVVPVWQVAASVAAQTLYAAGALWLAGRAFRLGMLRYGQRLNWRELFGRTKA